MSTIAPAAPTRSTRATAAATAASARTRVRLLVPPIRRTWRPSFISICVVLMIGCLTALLGINIALTRGAYTEQQLTLKQTALMEQEQTLNERVARESAPAVLAQRARDLGMIPNYSPAFIRMSDGAILGVPTPATLATAPELGELSSTPMTAEQAAAAAAAANGGVPVAGPDGLSAGQVVEPGEAAREESTTPQQGTVGDGAVPVGGAETADQVAASTDDGARPVGGGQ